MPQGRHAVPRLLLGPDLARLPPEVLVDEVGPLRELALEEDVLVAEVGEDLEGCRARRRRGQGRAGQRGRAEGRELEDAPRMKASSTSFFHTVGTGPPLVPERTGAAPLDGSSWHSLSSESSLSDNSLSSDDSSRLLGPDGLGAVEFVVSAG